MYLSAFSIREPRYTVAQSDGLRWLSQAHARAPGDLSAERLQKLMERYGCPAGHLDQRGTFLRDFTHQNWSEMQLFGDTLAASIETRMNFFSETLHALLAPHYTAVRSNFKNWIHVTCTGYQSPSVIQRLTSEQQWDVECLHAYHMGCYAAIPALRMARGNLDCEILHTELCTLHLDPSHHEPEQLVIQSLFADGVISYRASEHAEGLGFKVLDLQEKVVPGTLNQMRWEVSALGFKMTLAREVPQTVALGISNLVRSWQSPDCVYAIHPGGPRIIDAVKAGLNLSEEQVYFSREVLRLHGNMSSATLPHIWQKMSQELPHGTPVVSLAFGPGLTLAGSHMRSVRT